MFKRPHHQAIADVLARLDVTLFQSNQCWFGGGTAISLLLGEYRESLDIDFLCADQDGFRRLRSSIKNESIAGLFVAPITEARPVKMDQYGIRSILDVGGRRIKFEIVREARITLNGQIDAVLGVPVLSRISLFAEKLLANDDRHADRSVQSRDVIDLGAMIHHWGDIPKEAWDMARQAYGPSVHECFSKAIRTLHDHSYYQQCIQDMAIDTNDARVILSALKGAQKED